MNYPANISADQLRTIVERVERLDEEIKALNDDKKEVYAEAKGNGFDTKAIKAIVSIRRKDPDERAEHDAIVSTYMAALGMVPSDE